MNTPWSKRAACRGLDPTIFFPVTDDEAVRPRRSAAAAPCGRSCLEHALGDARA